MLPIGDPRSSPSGAFDTVTIGVPTGAVPIADARAGEPAEIIIAASPRLPRRTLGVAALGTALPVIGATAVAVGLATGGSYEAATGIAWAGIAVSGLAVILGLLAIATDRGRVWGAAAVVVGVVANPFLLRAILAFFDGPAAA